MKQNDIIELFAQSGALLMGHFKLSSGRHSDIYYEKFTLLKNPAISTRVCRIMADRLSECGAETVIGPTTGGIIIAYDVARYLGLEALYAEPGETGRIFKRGFSLRPQQKVVIVDDVLTTGRSVFEVIDLVRSYQADIMGVSVFLDRSGGGLKFDQPFMPLATVGAESWQPEDCPMCARGEPLTQRGSRRF